MASVTLKKIKKISTQTCRFWLTDACHLIEVYIFLFKSAFCSFLPHHNKFTLWKGFGFPV